MNPRFGSATEIETAAPTFATARPVTKTVWLLRFALSFDDPGRVGSLVQQAAEQRPRCLVVAKHIELIRYHRLRRRRRNGDESAPTDTGEALGIADRAVWNRINAVPRQMVMRVWEETSTGWQHRTGASSPPLEAAPLGDSRFRSRRPRPCRSSVPHRPCRPAIASPPARSSIPVRGSRTPRRSR